MMESFIDTISPIIVAMLIFIAIKSHRSLDKVEEIYQVVVSESSCR